MFHEVLRFDFCGMSFKVTSVFRKYVCVHMHRDITARKCVNFFRYRRYLYTRNIYAVNIYTHCIRY